MNVLSTQKINEKRTAYRSGKMIHLENEQQQVVVEASLLETIQESIGYALQSQGLTMEAEVSVLLVDNQAIREINKEHRQKDKDTDVLSFPMIDFQEGETFKDTARERVFGPEYYHGEALLVGDVVLSMEKLWPRQRSLVIVLEEKWRIWWCIPSSTYLGMII